MEPTGMSWFPVAAGFGVPAAPHVAHRLADSGVSVARVPSRQLMGANGSRRGAATSPNSPRPISPTPRSRRRPDLADAHVLAAIPGFGGPRLDPVHIPAPESHALLRLTEQCWRLQDAIADARRRLLDLIPSI